MSLTSSLQRIVSLKEDIRLAIESKGVSIASTEGLSTYPSYIAAISVGGGGTPATLISKTITANGIYNAIDDDADGYSSVEVSVAGGGGGDDLFQKYLTKTLESVNDTNGDLKMVNIEQFMSQSMLSYVNLAGCSIVRANAFRDCSELQEVSFSSGCTLSYMTTRAWGSTAGGYSTSTAYVRPSGVFYNCQKLSKITNLSLPSIVDGHTFYNCYEIESIELPQNITAIRESAFGNCSKLSKIIIPSNHTSGTLFVYDFAFAGAGLDENGIDLDFVQGTNVSNTWYGRQFESNKFTKLIFGGSRMAGSAIFVSGFLNCSLLSIVRISYATMLTTNIFGGCSALEEVTLPLCTNLYNGPLPTAKFGCTFSFPAVITISGYNYALGQASKLKLPNVTYFRTNYYYSLQLNATSHSYREVYFKKLSTLWGQSAISVRQGTYSLNGQAYDGVTMLSFAALSGLLSYGCIALSRSNYHGSFSVVITSTSVCAMNAASAIYPSDNLKIYVPSSMLDTYKTATNWIAYGNTNKIVALETLSIYFNYGGSKYWTNWGTTWTDFVNSAAQL